MVIGVGLTGESCLHVARFSCKNSVHESAQWRVRANEGRTLNAFGETVIILLDGKQIGEKFAAFLHISPPGTGPGSHYHEREDEWFYIVEGRVSFLLNGIWTDTFPGDCVYAPSVHALRTIQVSRPAFSSMPFPRDSSDSSLKKPTSGRNQNPDMSHITTVAEKYGIHSA